MAKVLDGMSGKPIGIYLNDVASRSAWLPRRANYRLPRSPLKLGPHRISLINRLSR